MFPYWPHLGFRGFLVSTMSTTQERGRGAGGGGLKRARLLRQRMDARRLGECNGRCVPIAYSFHWTSSPEDRLRAHPHMFGAYLYPRKKLALGCQRGYSWKELIFFGCSGLVLVQYVSRSSSFALYYRKYIACRISKFSGLTIEAQGEIKMTAATCSNRPVCLTGVVRCFGGR